MAVTLIYHEANNAPNTFGFFNDVQILFRISLHLTRRRIVFKMCEMAQNKILLKCANRTRIPTESTHMSHKSDSRFPDLGSA